MKIPRSIPNQKASFWKNYTQEEYCYEVNYCAYETEEASLCNACFTSIANDALHHPLSGVSRMNPSVILTLAIAVATAIKDTLYSGNDKK